MSSAAHGCENVTLTVGVGGPSTQIVVGCVSPRGGVDAIKKTKISSCQELNPDTPPTSHSIDLLHILQDYRLDAATGLLVRQITCIVLPATL